MSEPWRSSWTGVPIKCSERRCGRLRASLNWSILAIEGRSDKRDEHPIRLSGGQKQRVAMAWVLAMEPTVMMFDEPAYALDPELIGEVLDGMLQLAQEATTMLGVPHEMGLGREVADRISYTGAGKIVPAGPPKQVLSNLEDERAVAFLRTFFRFERWTS